jgi:hypothetical protein
MIVDGTLEGIRQEALRASIKCCPRMNVEGITETAKLFEIAVCSLRLQLRAS